MKCKHKHESNATIHKQGNVTIADFASDKCTLLLLYLIPVYLELAEVSRILKSMFRSTESSKPETSAASLK